MSIHYAPYDSKHTEDLTEDEWRNLLQGNQAVYFALTDKEVSQQWQQFNHEDHSAKSVKRVSPDEFGPVADFDATGTLYFHALDDELNIYKVFEEVMCTFDWDTGSWTELWIYKRPFLARFAQFSLRELNWQLDQTRFEHEIRYFSEGVLEHLLAQEETDEPD